MRIKAERPSENYASRSLQVKDSSVYRVSVACPTCDWRYERGRRRGEAKRGKWHLNLIRRVNVGRSRPSGSGRDLAGVGVRIGRVAEPWAWSELVLLSRSRLFPDEGSGQTDEGLVDQRGLAGRHKRAAFAAATVLM